MLKRYEVKPLGALRSWAIVVIDTDRGFFSTVSDRGNYAYVWSHPGKDFRAFLIELASDPHYLHSKLMSGRADRLVYDAKATKKAVRAAVKGATAGGKAQRNADEERALLARHDFSSEGDFTVWASLSQLDPSDLYQRKPHEDCLAFCTELYPRFVALLKEEDEAAVQEDVTWAILVWGKRQGFGEADRGTLATLRRADPSRFASMYPPAAELVGGALREDADEKTAAVTALKKLVREAARASGLSDDWRARSRAVLKACRWPEVGA